MERPHTCTCSRPSVWYGDLTAGLYCYAGVDTGGWVFLSTWPQVMCDLSVS